MYKIKTGMYLKNVFFGIGLAFIGIALTTILYINKMTIAISRIRLPQWSIFVIGGIFVIVGIILIITALKEELCSKCNSKVKNIEIGILPKFKDSIVNAIQNTDGLLETDKIKTTEDTADSLVLSIKYCGKCADFAIVNLQKNNNYTPETIIGDTYLPENKIKSFIDFADNFDSDEE